MDLTYPSAVITLGVVAALTTLRVSEEIQRGEEGIIHDLLQASDSFYREAREERADAVRRLELSTMSFCLLSAALRHTADRRATLSDASLEYSLPRRTKRLQQLIDRDRRAVTTAYQTATRLGAEQEGSQRR